MTPHSRAILNCCACGATQLHCALELPSLPLTGIYRSEGQVTGFPAYDQALMVCPQCGHAQLACALDSASLYGHDYGFRTSASPTATRGVEFFARYLNRIAPGRRFSRVLEFGCSDAVLLKLIKDRADRLLGVDPILRGREDEFADEKIVIAGTEIEKTDVCGLLGGSPDLIVSQHTLEHLTDPAGALRRLLDIAGPNTLFVVEFPCFDPLIEQLRFDQVFHQHVQYFSFDSFGTLLRRLDAVLIGHAFNYTYWGALLAAFQKNDKSGATLLPAATRDSPDKSAAGIRKRFGLFRRQMEVAAWAIADCRQKEIFGYGAALMLPILGYHLGTDFGAFEAILDDDPAKDGIGYANLPVRIRTPKGMDFTELTICLTAMDNRRPILRRLAEMNPKRIINPLCFI